jgi:hypothetical protein
VSSTTAAVDGPAEGGDSVEPAGSVVGSGNGDAGGLPERTIIAGCQQKSGIVIIAAGSFCSPATFGVEVREGLIVIGPCPVVT